MGGGRPVRVVGAGGSGDLPGSALVLQRNGVSGRTRKDRPGRRQRVWNTVAGRQQCGLGARAEAVERLDASQRQGTADPAGVLRIVPAGGLWIRAAKREPDF